MDHKPNGTETKTEPKPKPNERTSKSDTERERERESKEGKKSAGKIIAKKMIPGRENTRLADSEQRARSLSLSPFTGVQTKTVYASLL